MLVNVTDVGEAPLLQSCSTGRQQYKDEFYRGGKRYGSLFCVLFGSNRASSKINVSVYIEMLIAIFV